MKKKAKPINYEHCVEIYVPTECRCGKPLPEDIRAEALENVKSKMIEWFHGGSVKQTSPRVEKVDGFWLLDSGESANEPVDVVYSNATKETMEEHYEEVVGLCADLANRLTQETVAFRVDGKLTLMPGEDLKPHRCAGGGAPGELPIPLQPDEKTRMRALQTSLQRISSIRDARDLFCNILHYEFEDELLATVNWPDKLKDCLAPKTSPLIIADQNGFKILYLQLADVDLRKGAERQLVQRIIKDDPTLRGLVVVSDVDQKHWHLVNAKFEKEEGKRERLRLRRMRVGPGRSVRTAVERLSKIDVEAVGEDTSAAQLQDLHDRAFDVESVSKKFFNDISNWYFWALSQVKFPVDTLTSDDDEKHRATSLIRFLTRIIFCWFLKEKGLIPESLFLEKDLADILVDLDPDSCTYHQGIMQNLFFATLNQRMGKNSKGKPYRTFAKDEGFPRNKSTYGVDTLYRFEKHFQSPDTALTYFADVPFLNGGLFECLDRTDENTGKRIYVDGFSRNKKKRACVPNCLFFSREQVVDLSAAYGDKKRRNAKVRGLLHILHAYNFTIEENTPIDEEIALDPELLGKVFENLLASFNEETMTTARKQTGSFYTPRPIVEYMVDETLKAHLTGILSKLDWEEEEAGEQLDLLLGYTDEDPSFSEEESAALLEAINTCKILDPACGSGAFPIGMLQKLVHIVNKLDPENARWKQLQIDKASMIPGVSSRDAAIKAIERDFEENDDNYGRKLYIIENCLYGIDIQPIAIQISKLRFFISLICDQKANRDKAKNHGIRALPNLETKFVAADTLIGLPEMDQMALVDPRVNQIEAEIESLHHWHFSIQRRDQKLTTQSKLRDLRKELGQVLAESLGSPQKALNLAEWDPFDSQANAEFFDPHWMFGQALTEGFDIVIGNPPYIQIQKFPAAQKEIWKALKFKTYAATADIYCLFYERGAQLLREGGHLCYITSNKWMRAGYGAKLREFLSTMVDTSSVLDFGMAQNFGAATTYTCIVQVTKESSNSTTRSCYAMDDRSAMADPAGYFRENQVLQQNLGKTPWVVLSKERQEIKLLVEVQGIPLKDWDIQINYGIKTGLNESFYITQAQRDAFIAADAEWKDVLVPLLRGRKILRYGTDWDGTWMLFVPWHFPLHDDHSVTGSSSKAEHEFREQYPAVYDHLASFRDRLSERNSAETGIRYEWYALQRWAAGYHSEFSKPKIMYPNMTKYLPFFYDQSTHYFPNDKGFVITSLGSSLPYLTAVLNSHLFRCAFRENFPELKGNTYEVRKIFVELIPIKKPTNNESSLFKTLVPLIQFAKVIGDEAAFKFLEDLIDACVMECYFHEHMAERDLLFLIDLVAYLDGYDPDSTEAKQRDFLDHFHHTLNAKGSMIRDRLDRICKDSPNLLAVIKKEGKV
jgi:adenine-specific DNA-methyltransferase